MNQELVKIIEKKYQILKPIFNERLRRLWAAAEANAIGRGGRSIVSSATNLSRTTISKGLNELSKISLLIRSHSIALCREQPASV